MPSFEPVSPEFPDNNSPDMLIIPDGKTNQDFPNIAAGVLCALWNIPVIDFNTVPGNEMERVPNTVKRLGIVAPNSASKEINRLMAVLENKSRSFINSANGPIDIQCCYPMFTSDHPFKYDGSFNDHLPFPSYTRFDTFKLIQTKWREGAWFYPIMTSLGCPFGCTYCACRKRKIQFRSISNCVEELRRAKKKWGIRRFVIVDDCFNADIDRSFRFAEALAPLGLEWMIGNGLRADRFNEGLARALESAGCKWVAFGVETIDDPILAAINKGETFNQIDQAVKTAIKYFDYINVFLIIGLPGSTYETDRASIAWAKILGVHAHVSFYVPQVPRSGASEIFDNPHGRELPDTYDRDHQIELYKWACH